ncbi:N-acetyl-1-D-myo-inositol-2-amino-2-deoxy-alpha-D-glucopyranoside deacetylase [Cellulomonas shaoxiangyii]|uniref:N-acetyl-1-D-myo-inositol-2-amino-2-deoxy-alpha-D-glucopyranoside deacetylase n=1 Tax=Cellulomonas shaoxiangyii TaxID=2566013 RepID=A0A4P7SJN0_9CELL|nr:N-acetyl-1-D-myo-inositol-2-amino-2-deoxy-alpha-D-glucopyranoside deacetylase [Cellulomonas shaoxiangyii]QCB94352.1 N-acetyl-1-D-myo-inositol-2-amino-2-deoxy-alpha-D-glucopyranoside deacetylase [Cellulomonas shaoxiangyii]TGY85191.1 N-acetyl-1-D-myo-inositol-2-amino-2-deoxy-alpha-D-glucopyranoside deacetylase [Cellulomonas shaoxiangyii]
MTPTRTGGLLAVHAHPDDESLATGALLATWAAAGRPVTVVTATRGERGEVIGERWAHLEGDGPALAGHRVGELAGALAALGVRDHRFLDEVADGGARYEDSGMAWVGATRAGAPDDVPPGAFVGVPLEEAAGALARVLRSRRPEVVATYEPGGGYGHPDHVRTHEVTRRALELAAREGDDAGSAHVVPVVLWAAQGRAALRRAQAALAGPEVRAALGRAVEDLDLPDAAGEPASVAVPDDALDVEVDVLPVRERVLGALRAHATQVQAVRAVDGDAALVGCYALSNRVLAPVLPVEAYRYAPGSPRAGQARVTWPAGVRPVA